MSDNWKPRTKAVHSGTRRSQYNEVSEAVFLTQGFVYESAEQAEARFQSLGDDEFIYARYGNPTVRMFEDRISDLLGYEDWPCDTRRRMYHPYHLCGSQHLK